MLAAKAPELCMDRTQTMALLGLYCSLLHTSDLAITLKQNGENRVNIWRLSMR